MANYFEKADIVICRAGANTTSDIAAAKRPAIIIPIPWTIGDEQGKNAQKIAKTGLATILPQSELSGAKLVARVDKVRKNFGKIVKNADTSEYELDIDAAKKLVDLVDESLQ